MDENDKLIIGAAAIAAAISDDMTERQAYHLLATGKIEGAFKLGHCYAIRCGRLHANWQEKEAAAIENTVAASAAG